MRGLFLLIGCLTLVWGTLQAQDTLKVKNGIVIPKKTLAERNAITNPETGLLVFDPTEKRFFFYEGTKWKRLHPNSLDEAYDEGAKDGDGRFIEADSGAVEIKANGSIGLLVLPSDTTTGIWVDSAKGGDVNPAFYTYLLDGADGYEVDAMDDGSGFEIRHEGEGYGGTIYHEGEGSGLYISHEGDGDNLNLYKYPGKSGNSFTIYHEGTDTAAWLYNTADETGFTITQLGKGVAEHLYAGPGNDTTTLEIVNAGGGKGIVVNLLPSMASGDTGLEVLTAGSSPAIVVVQESDGEGVLVNAVGGTAGQFTRLMPGAPPTEIAKAELATAGGSAAYFEKAKDGPPAVDIKNSAAGPALSVTNTHLGTDAVVLNNMDPASVGLLLKATSFGEGATAEFNIDKSTNLTDCITANTKGLGSAGAFNIDNAVNSAAALIGISSGTGPGVEAGNDGTGTALLATKGLSGTSGYAAEFISVATAAEQTVRMAGSSSSFEVCNIVHTSGDKALRVDGTTELHGFTKVFGDFEATGTITGASKSFKIDHPLDPQNKYLYHVSIESDELLNIYTGNTMLNAEGEAIVELPDWFEALNQDFRYHLTCIGGFAQVYIAEEVKDNQFKIAGGKEGLKISWQVSGVRKDQHATERNFKVEVNKQK